MTSRVEQGAMKYGASHFIGGEVVSIEGDTLRSMDPAHPERTVWSGSPTVDSVGEAVGAARAALPAWSAWPIEKRVEVLRAFEKIATERAEQIGALISAETGKALWDATGEAKILAGKVGITLAEGAGSGRSRVSGFDVGVTDTRVGRCSFRPHGVMAVVGPFNFPCHLPNGHIIPALLMGNTVVFKPSDKTPATGQALAEMYIEALELVGAPAGVVNLVQGGAEVSRTLVGHEGVDGVLFTGSWGVGRKILESNLDTPGRIVALELGGNNPAVIAADADLRQAAIECARSAFVTTGQRCTCTRRIVVHESIADRFIGMLGSIASGLAVGDPEGENGGPVFMGPIIRGEARDAVVAFQEALGAAGADVVLASSAKEHASGGYYVTPGIARVGSFSKTRDVRDAGCDVEVFGPLVRVSTYTDFDDAMGQANATSYGLAASLFSAAPAAQERFIREANAGCVNINTGTAGASSKLPFGGLGFSGNHRPAGAFSLDYCAYPVASLVERGAAAGVLPGMRIEESWFA